MPELLRCHGTSRGPTVEVPSDGTEVVKDSQMLENCGALHLGPGRELCEIWRMVEDTHW